MSNRRVAREAALKSLYAVEVGNNSTQQVTNVIIKTALKDDTDSVKFAEKLLLITVDNAEEHDRIIDKHIKNWEVDRLAIIDKLILRMALTELLFFKEVPTKVSINEAIELAKKYSTRKSGNFVNGILDAALTYLKNENKIEKKGRGLIEESNH
ncbi:transcription antitermination factor NusB [Rhodohalobacter sp. 614A]|uniref:transcription antitermination factor NusB n=1 Tax=Rhodohalobacter sp. 614A TaxID=2908649 RepID=UPI001F42AD03|nr:transcription antitermination factor NusB [Rhodohalobacter sp. 614A]